MTTYVTKQGDMWDMIAYQVWGSADRMTELMRANAAHLDAYIFPAGVVLTIPDTGQAAPTANDFPPWRR